MAVIVKKPTPQQLAENAKKMSDFLQKMSDFQQKMRQKKREQQG